jgi:hypothetical protein
MNGGGKENSIPLYEDVRDRPGRDIIFLHDGIQDYIRLLPQRAGAVLCRKIEDDYGELGLIQRIIQQFPDIPRNRLDFVLSFLHTYADSELSSIFSGGCIPEFWKIFPNAKPETTQQPIHSMRFGSPKITFLPKPDTVIQQFEKYARDGLANQLLFSPAAVLSYPFQILAYAHKPAGDVSLTGVIFHPLLVAVTKTRKQWYELKIYGASKRVWNDQSVATLRLTRADMELNKELAHFRDAFHMAYPFEGGLPGQHS